MKTLFLFATLLFNLSALATEYTYNYRMSCNDDFGPSRKQLREAGCFEEGRSCPYQQNHQGSCDNEFGHKLGFFLTVEELENGSLHLTYVNSSTFYRPRPKPEAWCPNRQIEPCQEMQEQQVASQQRYVEPVSLTFSNPEELQNYIVSEYCSGGLFYPLSRVR